MTNLAVSRATVLRALRDRTALFFMMLLPVAIIVIGVTVRGFDEFRVGVVSGGTGALARELTSDLRAADGLRTRGYGDAADARDALRRAELDAVVLVPPGGDTAVRAGRSVTVTVLVEPSGSAGHSAVSSVSAVVARHAARLQAAHFADERRGGGFDKGLALARRAERASSPTHRAHAHREREERLPASWV